MAFREVAVFEVREVLRLWLLATVCGRSSGWEGSIGRRCAVMRPPRSWVLIVRAESPSSQMCCSVRWWRLSGSLRRPRRILAAAF